MRAACLIVVAAAIWLNGLAVAARADVVMPESAPALRDSVGVNTHVMYHDTAYVDWDRALARLEELGVRHLREGMYGNPAPQWQWFNETFERLVSQAAERGFKFTFVMGRPGYEAGTLDQLVRTVAGPLRDAAEALEAPNEYDHFVGGPRWPALLAAYHRALYRKAKDRPSLRSLPVLGPSLVGFDAPRRVGDLSASLDVGNLHPYTGGQSPAPDHLRSELARMRPLSGGKPVWATEVGFNNALRAGRRFTPVSESAAAVYVLRAVLEHFAAGIERTYLYELIDEKPDPRATDPEQHFGLLRNDFSRKPAFTALKNLLALTGPAGPVRRRPLRVEVSKGDAGVRRLVLQRADGTHLVVLWRLAEVWDQDRRAAIRVAPRRVAVALPGARRVEYADPIASSRTTPLRLRRGRVRVELAGRPVVLVVAGARAARR